MTTTAAPTTTTTSLRDVTLGTGRPKIIVPLVGTDTDALRAGAAALAGAAVDIVELRIDFLTRVAEPAAVAEAIAVVRETLADTVPVLFTFRTKQEGGEQAITTEAYEALIAQAVESKSVDAVDVEMFTEREALERIVANAHAAGVPVVMSSHDFHATPARDEILGRLTTQQQLGADVVKIAVMPAGPADVLTLLDATVAYAAHDDARPAITMSMAGLGVVSRLAGEVFGSAATFGAVGKTSAPGQIEAAKLDGVLTLIHDQA